ncbi:MAG TPA: magnesium transporter [archaeon]|nr:magnesium transporter [archaeon]
MEVLRKDFKEILGAELISVSGGLLAGLLLAIFVDKLLLIPGLLILLPGFLEMRGNISGSLSARLSSGLFLGALKPKFGRNRILRGNVVASFLLVIILSLLLGFVAYLVNLFVLNTNVPSIILVSFIAGLLSNLIEIPLTIAITFWFFRKGHDPSNVMGPYVTTIGDIVSIVALLIGIVVV